MYAPNKVHIHFSVERASDGTVIRSSILVDVNDEDAISAINLYREVKAQLEVSESGSAGTNHQEVASFPTCPDHQVKMLMRTRHSDGGIFFGCPLYSRGCSKTAQYPVQVSTT